MTVSLLGCLTDPTPVAPRRAFSRRDGETTFEECRSSPSPNVVVVYPAQRLGRSHSNYAEVSCVDLASYGSIAAVVYFIMEVSLDTSELASGSCSVPVHGQFKLLGGRH